MVKVDIRLGKALCVNVDILMQLMSYVRCVTGSCTASTADGTTTNVIAKDSYQN